MSVPVPARVALAGLSSRALSFALLVLAIPLIVHANRPLSGDVFWAMAYGRVLAVTGQMPTADPFTYAPHLGDYINAQWLSQILYYLPYQLADLQGVMAFNALACTLALGLVLYAGWRHSGSLPAAAAAVLLFAFPAVWFLSARAQTLALVPLTATYALLLCRVRGVHGMLALAAVEAVWANLHGSFFLAPLLTFVFLSAHAIDALRAGTWRGLIRDSRTQFLVAAGLTQVAASLATPFGFELYRYALAVSSHPFVREYILEWMPISLATPEGVQFFSALGLMLIVKARSARPARALDFLLLGLFTLMALQAYRNVILFSLICPPLMARFLADLRLPRFMAVAAAWLRRSDRSRMSRLRPFLIAVVVLMSMPWAHGMNPLIKSAAVAAVDEVYPQAAAAYLMSHNYGPRVLAEHYWGSYLDWALWPRYQPMVDPAIDNHSVQVWVDFFTIGHANVRWEELVDQYGADVLLLSYSNQTDLIDAAWYSPRWRMVYGDPLSVIFIRAEEVSA